MESELRAVILATNASLDELRDAHELLKKNHVRVLDKLAAAEQRAADAETGRQQVQAECRGIYQQWSDQLANQAQEFKNLESQMVPQHMVHLEKINLGNELRGNYEQEYSTLRKQIESIREELSQSRRDAQNYRIQSGNTVSEKELIQTRLSKTISSLREDLEAEKECVQEMQDMNSELQEKIRLLEARIVDLGVSEFHSRLDQEAQRKDAEEAVQAKCQLELSHLRTAKELQSQCSLLEAQLECHQAKAQDAVDLKEKALEQLKQSEMKNREYRIQIVELQQQLDEARSQCDVQNQRRMSFSGREWVSDTRMKGRPCS